MRGARDEACRCEVRGARLVGERCEVRGEGILIITLTPLTSNL